MEREVHPAADMSAGIQKTVALPYDAVLAKLPDALKAEGFGVLTEIDVRSTLRDKLGVEFRPYKIFGACNPPLAHRALQAELGIGVMLPCNVVVYAEGDQSVVIAIDPMETIAASSPALRPIAEEVRGKLTRVLERL
ncbi:MAG TPA: DUF302 domain-containing protein [Kofleriaceae bacterium]